MKNCQVLGAIALDLKRVAIGYFRGSDVMAEKFYAQALKRKKELDNQNLKPYLITFLNKLDKIKKQEKMKVAEDALLYSTIFQNAAIFR